MIIILRTWFILFIKILKKSKIVEKYFKEKEKNGKY